MIRKTVKKAVAFSLAVCLATPTVSVWGSKIETQAADEVWSGEVGDTNMDGSIDVIELIRIKKNASTSPQGQYDLDNDGACDETDASLMRRFLVGKISSFYRPDTSTVNNTTATYQVTDELERQMTSKEAQNDKAVGIRYFLHFATEDSNPLYSVSEILAKNSNAYESSAAWINAGGGAVGADHWWGKPLFGYYSSMDEWVVERDVQMLTDAGIDFLAIDTTDDVVYTKQLELLLTVLDKYNKQGFEVPKVTFTSDVSEQVSELKKKYSHLWYKDSINDIGNVYTIQVAESMEEAMSSSAFYGKAVNHGRTYSGKKHESGTDAELYGYHFEYQFNKAVSSGANTILVENWNEWLANRAEGTDKEPIVLKENASITYSSDIQPMEDGYGDDYYMQLVECIKEFKGNAVTNHKLNTASMPETVTIDIAGSFQQWNKVSTHYLDYTDEIGDRSSNGYSEANTEVNNMAEFELCNMKEFSSASASNFVTKEAYPGGSKISFQYYLPEDANASWWKLCWTTSLSAGDNYGGSGGAAITTTTGAWTTFECTLPEGDESYYIYIGGPAGEWSNTKVLIDDFTIVSGDTTVTDDFSKGLSDGLFTTGNGVNLKTEFSVSSEETVVYTNTTGRNDISKMKMTSDGQYLYALVETVDDIQDWGTANCMSLFLSTGEAGGCWNQYEYVVNRNSAQASATTLVVEQYNVGAWEKVGEAQYRIEGNKLQLAIPLSALGCDDALSLEFKWADNYKEDDIYSFYTDGDAAPYGRLNYVYQTKERMIGLTVGKMNDIGELTTNVGVLPTLVTKTVYPAGSTVSFSYYISGDAISGWCGLGWTTDLAQVSNYNTDNTNIGTTFTPTRGSWQTFSCTITGEGDQYIYFKGPVGDSEWGDTEVLIDDFTITDASGNVIAKETFDGGVGIFNTNSSAARLITADAATESKQAAQLNFRYWNVDAGKSNFVTKDKYPSGSTIEFDAYIPEYDATENKVGWWKYCLTSTPETYDVYEQGTNGSIEYPEDWYHYTLPITEDSPCAFLIAGPAGEWIDTPLYIDNFKVYNEKGELIAKDDFSRGLHNGLFDVEELTGSSVAVTLGIPGTTGMPTVTSKQNYMSLNTQGDGNETVYVRTAEAYAAGSTVSFDAYVQNNADWWGIAATNDLNATEGSNQVSIYNARNDNVYYDGAWSHYEFTLPESDGPYYFYFGNSRGGNTWSEAIKIDNVTVTSPSGKVLVEDDFDYTSFTESMFTVLDSTKVSLEPEEKAEDGIDITAYSAPNVNGQVNASVKDELDDAYAKLAEAGFTKAIAVHEGYSTATLGDGEDLYSMIQRRTGVVEESVELALELAEKYNISYYVKDWSFYNLGKNNVSDSTDESVIWYGKGTTQVNSEDQFKTIIESMFSEKKYLTSPAYAGHFAHDEPQSSTVSLLNQWTDFTSIGHQANYYQQAMTNAGSNGEMLVNLLPNYGGSKDSKYEDYVTKYLEIAKKYGLGYISWDYYPFMSEGNADKESRETKYLYNYEIMANKTKTGDYADIELRTMIQAHGEEGYGLRNLNSAADYRFQIYTGMAFGVQEFTYYTYSGSGEECLYDRTNASYTAMYDWAKEVNNEVHGMEDFYQQYKWDSSMYRSGESSTTMSSRMLSGLTASDSSGTHSVDGTTKATIMSCSQDTLAGIFTVSDTTNTSRPYGYMIVNVSDPAEGNTDTVTMTFDGAEAVSVCQGGTQKLERNGDTYTFELKPGEGIFVVPILN